MELPLVSVALTVARALKGLTIPEAATIAGVRQDEVFEAENFLEEANPIAVQLIALRLGVDLEKLDQSLQ